MIALQKTREPEVLKRNYNSWTQTLSDLQKNGDVATETQLNRYNCKEIKDALKAETRHKCAYCESKFEHVAYGDIEHIVPKKIDVSLRFLWSNLTIACDICNTGKGAREDIVDPYATDPEEVFFFFGPIVLPKPNSVSAVITEHCLKLNRPALVERRAERIKELHRVLLYAQQNAHSSVRKAILADFEENEGRPDKEYAAIGRSYIRKLSEMNLLDTVKKDGDKGV